MATIKDVSKHAGVSPATVSRVLNGSELVVEKTRVKVMAAVEALGYRPNTLARAMASGRSGIVGMVVPEMCSPIHARLLGEAEALFRQHKIQLIGASGHCDPAQEQEAIEFLLQCRCDALILMVEAIDDGYLQQLAKRQANVVLINRTLAGFDAQCVTLDNVGGSQTATAHLIANGHQRIGYISGPLAKQDARDRRSGFEAALAQHGLTAEPDWFVEGDFTETGGYEGMSELASAQLSAIFCGNDEMAFGALAYCREHNIAVPEQVSIMGFDDLHFARYTFPALTTMDFPAGAMAIAATRHLLRTCYQIDIPAQPEMAYKPSLVVRDSVQPR
ncbi:LacI family transcriptional regulator [Neiella marina]|uniref:LacI family transcriptional regulator n=1 Tax=Neiella holothuriorum TaxID=2870530 RepID=A0ABS7EIF9_9GAMM|nr:LacI family DNA-binding transcriptional regulator [Neiella holothuriorum]MBW8192121.1 LacI family transcriptional regulator [Neiella holothuriorum]